MCFGGGAEHANCIKYKNDKCDPESYSRIRKPKFTPSSSERFTHVAVVRSARDSETKNINCNYKKYHIHGCDEKIIEKRKCLIS